MSHGENGDLVSKLEVAAKAESESSELGPVAERFFRALVAVAFFLAPPLVLYALYVFISVFVLHRNP